MTDNELSGAGASGMSRRDFGKTLAQGLGAAVLASSFQPALAQSRAGQGGRRPNIVFIFSDQHSYKYTGYSGHPHVRTPNLDRIASQGAAFTSAYVQNPVCVPSRSSMWSGMYPSDVNSFCNATAWDGSRPSWARLLTDAGYECLATGKVVIPDFDEGKGYKEAGNVWRRGGPDRSAFFRRPVCYRTGKREGVEGIARPGRSARDRDVLKEAETLIRERAGRADRPWAIYAGAYMPHPSFRALKEHYDSYYPDNVDMPEIPPGHLEDLHLVFQEQRHFDRIATSIPEERVRRARAAYYGMITELDEYIGEVWKTLEETGELENTIFVYSTDHGESLGEHGMWYKNNLYDVSARVPLVIAGAGIPRGVRVDTPVGLVDLVRTFIDWAGAEASPDLRGHSLVPLMHGQQGDHPGFAFSESHSEGNCTGSFMIRKGDWKYLHFVWHDDLLFNVREDPGEFRNRINDPAAASVREELKAILRSQVDPEEVTLRSFRIQEQVLEEIAGPMTEEQLADYLIPGLGEGQGRILANLVKSKQKG